MQRVLTPRLLANGWQDWLASIVRDSPPNQPPDSFNFHAERHYFERRATFRGAREADRDKDS